jgi:phosphoribosyl 1,2-cyclic phosphodiesterase
MENQHSQSEFIVRFWGVRGSVPSPGTETVRYGGNTSCIDMVVEGKHLIFDGGTGIRMLGKTFQAQAPTEHHLLFTHYHWDHIQGVPFFLPTFSSDHRFNIYGQVPPGGKFPTMEEHFQEHVLHLNSPVPVKEVQATLNYQDLVCGEPFEIDGIKIETYPLNHPNGAMGYRVSWQGKTAVYCTDTEHFPDRLDENVVELARDADLLIYDAMYTDEEYSNSKAPKVGWGHSTWQEGVKVAQAAGVKQLVIFHHEPNHSDDFLDEIEKKVKVAYPSSVMAKEGLSLKLI